MGGRRYSGTMMTLAALRTCVACPQKQQAGKRQGISSPNRQSRSVCGGRPTDLPFSVAPKCQMVDLRHAHPSPRARGEPADDHKAISRSSQFPRSPANPASRSVLSQKARRPHRALGASPNPIKHMCAPTEPHGDRVCAHIRPIRRAEHKRMGKLTGGCVLRKRPQLILANHLCCLTSEAPLLLPRRVHSRLSRRRVMMSLPALGRDERN